MKIGISAGDPAGIGLEIILRSLPTADQDVTWVLYTAHSDFESNIKKFGDGLSWKPASRKISTEPKVLQVVFLNEAGPHTVPGKGTSDTGRRALLALEEVSQAALRGELDGMVTGPLNKHLVGMEFSGHTDYLAERAGVSRVAMSFFTPTFKVVLATTHVPLALSLRSLSLSLYAELLQLITTELGRYDFVRPRIAVAAVNPHAGEHGLFGHEDDEILRPAVQAAQESGFDVSGPYPADSLYLRAHRGEFDVVIAPYHDQGLIPVKLIAPRSAANITLGLPYVRTSPDHGTAFPIAGKGLADAKGMETAMRWAVDLIRRRSARSK